MKTAKEKTLPKVIFGIFSGPIARSCLKKFVNGIVPVFDYLENRLTGNRNCMFESGHLYLICELVQLYDISAVAENSAIIDLVARLVQIKPFRKRPGLMVRFRRDMPTYIVAANRFSIDHGNVDDFT
jgi:hypothetical protein